MFYYMNRFWIRPAISVVLILPAVLILALATARNSELMLQVCVVSIFVVPAFIMALLNSRYILPYTISLWIVGPEVRRVTDWLLGSYHEITLISLLPQLATLALLLNIKPIHEQVFNRVAVHLLVAAYMYASLIGVLLNQISGIFAVLNSITPLLIFLYLITNRIDEKQKNMFIRTYVSLAVISSIYGWVQYLVLPPWDSLWLEGADMNSIGFNKPMEFRVFSTLNSQVPFAIFLCTALVPMIVNREWRKPFGLVGVLLVLSVLFLTLVRGAWITLIIGVLACILFSKSKNRLRSIIIVSVIAVGVSQLLPYLPGAERITDRIGTLGSVEEDHSYNERLNLFSAVLPSIIKNPLGHGFGSTGRSSLLTNSSVGMVSEDNGYLSVLANFGVAGAVCVFAAIYLMFRRMNKITNERDLTSFQVLSKSMLVQLLVIFMFVGSLSGFNAVAFWFFASLALTASTDEMYDT